MKLFNWFKKKEPVVQEPQRPIVPRLPSPAVLRKTVEEFYGAAIQRTADEDRMPGNTKVAMDGMTLALEQNGAGQLPQSLLDWYGGQGFIGYQAAAILASNSWLIRKCCKMPARDAIRKGYEITVNDGTEVSTDILDAMRKLDLKYKVRQSMEEFVSFGRVFGVRVAFFEVESSDPEYYQKPFNPDGVTPGSYKGIVQVDPYWCTPLLDADASSNPASRHFYEPTYWMIQGRKIHRSHVVVMRYAEVADVLKPTYFYGGVPLPQLIYERVYCAERVANEGPQLALTKRSTIYRVDLAQALANQDAFEKKLQYWAALRDNYGVRAIGLEEEVEQLDTSLADLDAVIMTSYQIVAAAANIPATKLLGTTPKGFNATGEFEESNYHEELESIQSSDLTPLLERHHLLMIRSYICPKFGIEPFETTVTWAPLDALNATEQALLNKTKAETGGLLIANGAIDGADERQRITSDPNSGYSGLQQEEYIDDLEDNDSDSGEETDVQRESAAEV